MNKWRRRLIKQLIIRLDIYSRIADTDVTDEWTDDEKSGNEAQNLHLHFDHTLMFSSVHLDIQSEGSSNTTHIIDTFHNIHNRLNLQKNCSKGSICFYTETKIKTSWLTGPIGIE